jgi:hypothetical protein
VMVAVFEYFPSIYPILIVYLQQVGLLIRPPVGNVLEFLWSHMRFDLDTILRAIGRSVDDVLVLVHVLLVQAIGIQYQSMCRLLSLGPVVISEIVTVTTGLYVII